MHKFIRNINEMFADTAKRKLHAANARFGKQDYSGESAKEIYLKACETIFKAFEPSGFSYAKSGPKFTKKGTDFTYQVSFQSSHNNVSGQHVALWIHGGVSSKRMKAWRQSQPNSLAAHEWIAGGQIGNLLPQHGWLEWELANVKERDVVIADAVATIRKIALPYFDQFNDVPAIISKLCNQEIPAMDVVRSIEFALCYGKQEDANAIVRRFFRDRPVLVTEYRQHIQVYREQGLPSFQAMGYAKDLARATLVYALDVV